MRILVFNDTFYPVIGGITTVVDSTATILSRHADVLVAAVKAKNYEDPVRSYNIIRCKGYYSKITKDGFGFPSLDKSFAKQIQDFKPDIIHVHTAGNFMSYAYKLRRKFKIPVVATIHTDYYNLSKNIVKLGFLAKLITKFLLRKNLKADAVWTVSKICKNQILKFNKTKKIDVVYNGTTLTANLYNAAQLKQKYSCENFFVISFCTRMVKLKNIDLIIKAMHLIHNQRGINAKVFLAGDGVDRKYFEQEVKRLGIEQYFVFTGFLDKKTIGEIYAMSDLVVFPSVVETSGLIQIEAAAFSKPTLVIKDAAPSEMIQDGLNGLISENEPKAFAEKILFAYDNQEKLKQIGINAKKDIYISYNDDYAKMLLEKYQNVISNFQKK